MNQSMMPNGCVVNYRTKRVSYPNSRNLLNVLKQESVALKDAIQVFNNLSFQENVLPSELATIKETRVYLKRRRQLVVNMRKLLKFTDKA